MGGISKTVIRYRLPVIVEHMATVAESDVKVFNTLIDLTAALTDPACSPTMRYDIATSIQASLKRMRDVNASTAADLKQLIKSV